MSMGFDFSIGQQFDQFRQAYPGISAGGLILTGMLIGFGAAWFLLRQEIATYRARLEHAQDVIDKKSPAATYRPIRFRKDKSLIAGLGMLLAGLLLAILGTVFIFFNLNGEKAPVQQKVTQSPKPDLNASGVFIQEPVAPLARLPDQPKQFTDKTARELLALYVGRTPFQAEKLIAPYKGKWIHVHGSILTILPDGRPRHSVIVLKDGDATIECRVGPNWAPTVEKLNKGDRVSVSGKISDNQNGSQLYLLDCGIEGEREHP